MDKETTDAALTTDQTVQPELLPQPEPRDIDPEAYLEKWFEIDITQQTPEVQAILNDYVQGGSSYAIMQLIADIRRNQRVIPTKVNPEA